MSFDCFVIILTCHWYHSIWNKMIGNRIENKMIGSASDNDHVKGYWVGLNDT